MDDDRVWSFEESLWTGSPETYEQKVDPECLMALPIAPFVISGRQSIDTVKATPRWSRATFTQGRIARPEEGLIVVAYHVRAERDGHGAYEAHCTSTYRRLAHDVWRVVQHAQVPLLAKAAQNG